MTIQEVTLMAMAKKPTWIEASQILAYTDRHIRRVNASTSVKDFMAYTTGGAES